MKKPKNYHILHFESKKKKLDESSNNIKIWVAIYVNSPHKKGKTPSYHSIDDTEMWFDISINLFYVNTFC